ncbi:PspC domain-containing protein [Gracilibacillus lacisalsi]|uniref:PspC domain-containing protein n=1 Tax=Gracilibacillus lacisalsi TaxID=393087 RepID=UPI00036AB5F4|nr:PspC domain-containing protein [Gracilibacillus lacisalsi]
MRRRLRKSGSDRSVHGVCGGIAEYFGISSFLVRLLFLFVMPAGFIIYIILSNILPDSPKTL